MAQFERKLSTILSADIVGYSRMMAKSEEQTLETFIGYKRIFETLLKAHNGRIFNTAGDSILAEFPSTVEGVRCAIRIQEQLARENEVLDPSNAVVFRIGINLGDVVVQGTDLLGDGVNIAARVQSAAPPGGICISGDVFDQIQGKLPIPTMFLGERIYKNIPKPVRTYLIKTAQHEAEIQKRAPIIAVKGNSVTVGPGEIFLLALLGFAAYVFFTGEEGLHLGTVNCSTVFEDTVPKESIDPNLALPPNQMAMLEKGIHCTNAMTCYLPFQPWVEFGLQPSAHQLPYSDKDIYFSGKST